MSGIKLVVEEVVYEGPAHSKPLGEFRSYPLSDEEKDLGFRLGRRVCEIIRGALGSARSVGKAELTYARLFWLQIPLERKSWFRVPCLQLKLQISGLRFYPLEQTEAENDEMEVWAYPNALSGSEDEMVREFTEAVVRGIHEKVEKLSLSWGGVVVEAIEANAQWVLGGGLEQLKVD